MLKFKYIIISLFLLLLAGCTGEGVYDIDGVFEVEKVDQTTPTLNLFFTKEISKINLTQNLTLGQRTFNITSNVAPQVGEFVCLKDADGDSTTQEEIESVISLGGNLYQVTIHAPVEFPFTTEDGCSIRTNNMAVDGSTTEQTFSISPLGLDENVAWDITRIICVALGDGDGASNDKPDGTSLLTQAGGTDGFYIRAENTYRAKNLLHVKNNAEIIGNMFDLQILDANRGGLYQVTFRFTWGGDDKHGAVIRLNADENSTDYHRLLLVVQEDLTDVSSFTCKLQGHETDDFWNYVSGIYGSLKAYFTNLFS